TVYRAIEIGKKPNKPSELNCAYPVFSFVQSDPDVSDALKYKLQISTMSDFSEIVFDYTSDFISQGKTEFVNTKILPPGNYYWRVMSIDNHNCGSDWSVANHGLVSFTIADDSISGTAKAIIKVPKNGKRIRGNAVTVFATATENTTGVVFQYKSVASELISNNNSWVDIAPIDKKFPFAVYWNVSGLSNGEYKLRAVAYDKNNISEANSETITVYVDDVNSDIVEDGNPEVNPNVTHRRIEYVNNNTETEAVIADGTAVIVPSGTIHNGTALIVQVIPPEQLNHIIPAQESVINPIGIYRRIEFNNGMKIFDKKVTISLPFHDENNDGIVDNTDIQVETLGMYYFDETTNEWK
ncbi:MAG: hypothetical protein QME68_08820, partial [Elusimicrobiota bacterium]|nr:hypothetical protein [Elusimicrobiota bacterium]